MKYIFSAIIATLLLTGGAYAQSISINPGNLGVGVERPRDRVIEREVRRDRGDRFDRRERFERRDRYDRRAERRGRERCRTITTREETRRGVVRRTTRVCD